MLLWLAPMAGRMMVVVPVVVLMTGSRLVTSKDAAGFTDRTDSGCMERMTGCMAKSSGSTTPVTGFIVVIIESQSSLSRIKVSLSSGLASFSEL